METGKAFRAGDSICEVLPRRIRKESGNIVSDVGMLDFDAIHGCREIRRQSMVQKRRTSSPMRLFNCTVLERLILSLLPSTALPFYRLATLEPAFTRSRINRAQFSMVSTCMY